MGAVSSVSPRMGPIFSVYPDKLSQCSEKLKENENKYRLTDNHDSFFYDMKC